MEFAEKYGPWGTVVGGSQGLGRAMAREMARRGLNVLVTARGAGALEEAARELRDETGVEVRTLALDAADPQICEKVDAALDGEELGMLIYNCAAEHRGEFLDVTREHHLDTIAVNCTSATMLVHHFAPAMVKRGRGGIVLSSSLSGKRGTYSWATYSASKAYVMLLGETLWYELGLHGVDVCAFMIGTTYTPNFINFQKEKGSIFAETRTPEGLPEGMPFPQPPEEAAANLFAQLEGEWKPHIYANPLDKEREDKARLDEPEVSIRRMGDMMRSGYRSEGD